MDWRYINTTPVPNTPVWIYTRFSYVFDIGFWNGRRWLTWREFDDQETTLDPGVVAWSPIEWSEVDQSFPSNMRIKDDK